MEAVENLKEKQLAHAEIAKSLEEAEAAMNKLSEKEKIIQKQSNPCLRRKSNLMQRWVKG